MKLKCIDATSPHGRLTEDRIYDGKLEIERYRVVDDDGREQLYFTWRFETINEMKQKSISDLYYTIEELRVKKIVIKVNSLEEFRAVQKYGGIDINGPAHRNNEIARYPYYIHIYGEGGYNGHPNCYYGFEEIEYKQVIFPEEFKLPKYWAVAVTKESADELGKWRKTRKLVPHTKDGYCLSEFLGDRGYWVDKLPEGFTEITYEQFLKYILKQETMEKEIEYYEVVKPVPLHTFRLGDRITKEMSFFENLGDYPEHFKPVYKKEEPIVVGKYSLQNSYGSAKFGCKLFSKETLRVIQELIADKEIGASIVIHGTTITPELITKIFNQLK